MGLNDTGVPGRNLPAGEAFMQRQIKDLERAYRELVAAGPSMFTSTFARLDAADAATAAQQATLTTTVSGLATAVANIATNLASINAVIGAQVAVDNASGASNGMAVPIGDLDAAGAVVAVPAGYSQALVFLEVTASAVNSTAAIAALYIEAVINGTPTRLMGAIATPGGTATLSTAKSVTLTGLSGGYITVYARVRTDNGWAANASNRAYSEAIVVFLR